MLLIFKSYLRFSRSIVFDCIENIPLIFLSSRRPLICAARRRGRRDPARGERDRGGRGEGHEHDDEHEHRGAIDGDGRPPSRRCRHRARGRSGREEHTRRRWAGGYDTNAAARLTGRAAMAHIVGGMKYS